MRVLGGALLALAGLWSGLLARDGLRRSARRCGGLCRMLELLGYELERFRTPLPELFSALSRSADGEAAALCGAVAEELDRGGRFSGAWARGTEPLPPPERDILRPLGDILGRYGAEEQTAAVESALRRMEDLRRTRERTLRDRGRVCVGMCSGLGLMLAVLLL